jgi:tetratricopeptide (TPR) repeat protein
MSHYIFKKYLLLLVVILISLIFIPTTSRAQTKLAIDDYASYLKSRYAKEKWNPLVKKGFETFHSLDYEAAQNVLFKAFNMGCESPIVLFQLALINEYKGSYYSSLEFYQMAKKGFTKSNKGHRYSKSFNENYGRALYFSGNKQTALPLLKKAGRKSKSYWLLKLLGLLAYEAGDSLNAVSYLERAVRVRSQDVTKNELVYVYSLLGKLFLHKGEPSGAYRYYKKVLELDPRNAEAKRYIKQVERQNKHDDMLKLIEQL